MNSLELCCGTYNNVVPTLNSQVEGSKTQHCPRFHCDPDCLLTGALFLRGSAFNVVFFDSPNLALNSELRTGEDA